MFRVMLLFYWSALLFLYKCKLESNFMAEFIYQSLVILKHGISRPNFVRWAAAMNQRRLDLPIYIL